METDPTSIVFDGVGPIGQVRVELMPTRSVAVDL